MLDANVRSRRRPYGSTLFEGTLALEDFVTSFSPPQNVSVQSWSDEFALTAENVLFLLLLLLLLLKMRTLGVQKPKDILYTHTHTYI